MGHQDTKQTSMRPRLKELNDIPYLISKVTVVAVKITKYIVKEWHNNAYPKVIRTGYPKVIRIGHSVIK